ncbi:MAG: tyrosine-type recombinase/integrase [Solirubrobacteraceae bacterium]
MSAPNPTATVFVREQRGQAFYEAFWRYRGKQLKRRLGPAWLDQDAAGEWTARKGRVAEGYLDERRAHVAAAELVAAYVEQADDVERTERERRAKGMTFRELAGAYLDWLENVRAAKPSTLRDLRSVLAEPDQDYRRGRGATLGRVMGALGDRPAAGVTTHDVEALLASVAASGVSPRTVNKYRDVIRAVYGHGIKKKMLASTENPAAGADKREAPKPGPLAYYSVEEVEALARAMETGSEGAQDAEAVRVSAYAGLRLGELLALRWRDVDFAGSRLTVGRALSAGVETSPKSRRVRQVPMPDQAAAALDRLSRRENFTGPGERVFCGPLGRTLDASALRRRYRKAQATAELAPLRWHDLRHSYGSLLAAAGVDLVKIKSAMGHSNIATTERYLHARPASEQAAEFTAAFAADEAAENTLKVAEGRLAIH